MLKKLRFKFVCINMLIVTTMLCVIFGTMFSFTKQNLEAESIRMMQDIAQEPFLLGRPNENADNIRLPYFTLQIGMRGALIATGGGYYDLSDKNFLAEVMTAALNHPEQTGTLKAYDLRFYRQTLPTGEILVFADTSSEQTTLLNMVKNFSLIGLISFLLFLGISLLLARWAVKPVDQAWAQQKQFVADASHELKTPLTVILTNAELLQAPDLEETDRSQFSGNILAMSHQMRGLVEGLLELARVDNGAVKISFAPLNLSALVEDAVLPFEPLYFEKGLELESHLEPDLQLKGSDSHLRQVVEILLDNAMKYADPQTKVWVTLHRSGRDHLLTVANVGTPLTPEECKAIFKRFYRTDKVRSMTGSYGLGLPIAEGIVTAHKGRIWAETNNGYNIFHVQLPALNT